MEIKVYVLNCSLELFCQQCRGIKFSWKRALQRVRAPYVCRRRLCTANFRESRSLEVERQVGGKFHLKLNTCPKPIENKYCEGKMKRTLKRELKVPELVEGEAN